MKTNSSAGDAKNNNHDPTLRDHEGGKGPAATALKDREFPDRLLQTRSSRADLSQQDRGRRGSQGSLQERGQEAR